MMKLSSPMNAIGRRTYATATATQRLLNHTGASIPVIKGPMYPGSNPELVAAVSEAGGFGVVQPISLTHLYGHDFREGLRLIKSLTSQPFGVNFTIVPNKKYQKQMDEWMDIAIDEGIKFFLTSLGKPDKIVRKAEKHNIVVYHDVHTPEVAVKAAGAGVHGLNCLNSSMGGQTGAFRPEPHKALLPVRPHTAFVVCSVFHRVRQATEMQRPSSESYSPPVSTCHSFRQAVSEMLRI